MVVFRSVSTHIYASFQNSQSEVRSQISQLGKEWGQLQDNMLARFDGRLAAMEHRVITAFQPHTHILADLPQQAVHEAPTTNELAPATLHVKSPSRRASLCDIRCTCACHHATKFCWSVTLLRSAIGAVEVAYSSRSSQSCTNPACHDFQRGQNVRDVRIAYHLPDWLARISASVLFSNNVNGSPQMNIRMYNRRSAAEAWETFGAGRLIDTGDTEGVKRALGEGRMSVYDVYGEELLPALWFALENKHPAMIKLLLQAGADPFHKIETLQGRSVMSAAFQSFNTGLPGDATLASLFPIAKYIEELDCSPLHLAILGITHIDLETMLQTPTYASYIDRKNAEGMAPIHLAAMRGDSAATRLLIRAGADVNIRALVGTRPLYYASLYGHYEVAEALLSAGADVDAVDNYNRRPIHGAASCKKGNAMALLSLLLQHSANMHTLSNSQLSPLAYAVTWGTPEAARYLLERGSNSDECGHTGGAATVETIESVAQSVAKLLLEQGCGMTAIGGADGRNVLHGLAINGDAKMMKLFTERRLRGTNGSVEEAAGEIPRQGFDGGEPGSELREALGQLLKSIQHHGSNDEELDQHISDVSPCGHSTEAVPRH